MSNRNEKRRAKRNFDKKMEKTTTKYTEGKILLILDKVDQVVLILFANKNAFIRYLGEQYEIMKNFIDYDTNVYYFDIRTSIIGVWNLRTNDLEHIQKCIAEILAYNFTTLDIDAMNAIRIPKSNVTKNIILYERLRERVSQITDWFIDGTSNILKYNDNQNIN